MTIDQLKELPIGELKSLAYDQMLIMNQTETNLRTLNQLIAEKSQPAEKPVMDEPKEEQSDDK